MNKIDNLKQALSEQEVDEDKARVISDVIRALFSIRSFDDIKAHGDIDSLTNELARALQNLPDEILRKS